jgi:hypothetical protein
MAAPLEGHLESDAAAGIAVSGERRVCRPGTESDDVRIDPEFEGLIPPLSAGELAALHRSLEAEGCRDALIVWKDEHLLVDGHNRLRWCRAKGRSFAVVEKEFADREEVKAYIVREQLGRRNLSPVAESYLRGKRYLELRHQGRKEPTSGHSDPKRASERLAEEFKVGEKTIRRDGAFAAAVDAIVAACGAEARNLILVRETGLTRGGVRRLARAVPVAAALLLSSYGHLDNSFHFLSIVYSYKLVGPGVGVVVAATMPAFQMTLGLALLFVPALRRAAFGWCILLFAGFVGVQSFTLARGLDVSCGCFGSSRGPIGPVSIGIAAGGLLLSLAGYAACARLDARSRGRGRTVAAEQTLRKGQENG